MYGIKMIDNGQHLLIEEAAKQAAFRRHKITVVAVDGPIPYNGLSANVTVAKDGNGELRAWVRFANSGSASAEDATIIASVAKIAARLASEVDKLLISHNYATAK